MKIFFAICKVIGMTIAFPVAVIINFFGLRLWRKRYKDMQNESRDLFDEIPSDFR